MNQTPKMLLCALYSLNEVQTQIISSTAHVYAKHSSFWFETAIWDTGVWSYMDIETTHKGELKFKCGLIKTEAGIPKKGVNDCHIRK